MILKIRRIQVEALLTRCLFQPSMRVLRALNKKGGTPFPMAGPLTYNLLINLIKI